jgi:UDP-N-acetyl-D-glucosamine/UDP-N-acetyl-D-galactosamine dehydrogenase
LVQELLQKLENRQITVCVVGIGYVGYPLACAFSHHLKVIGFDIDSLKVENYNNKHHQTSLSFTTDELLIKDADVVIICVPTPVEKTKIPDFQFVEAASAVVGRNLKSGSVVVYESTYYPGVTEELAVPLIEKYSGLTCGNDFWIGYSPERINPGDYENNLGTITKLVAGMNDSTKYFLVKLYGLITKVYPVKDIRTAEAAKVIENIQRDLNIALINELTLIMHILNIDIDDVLDAAATKWNFHRYSPGLVGGHCIPVDPYYLVQKAKELGYHPQVILAGRAINDSMPNYIAEMAIKGIIDSEKLVKNSKVLIMGLTYKENVPDFRESPSIQIISKLSEYGVDVFAYDPYCTPENVTMYGAKPFQLGQDKMDCIIFAVKHKEFYLYSNNDIKKMIPLNPVMIDVKGIYKDRLKLIKDMIYRKL